MTYKFLEIRDVGAFIPVLAFSTNAIDEPMEAGGWLLRKAGFGFQTDCVYVVKLATGGAEYDPYNWRDGSRTMQIAHSHIEKHWQELKSGDVVDVEFILGLSKAPKTSERLEA